MSGNSTARVSYKQLRLASVVAETAEPVHPPRLGDLEPEARGAGVGRPSGDFALVESDLEGALECGEHVAGLCVGAEPQVRATQDEEAVEDRRHLLPGALAERSAQGRRPTTRGGRA